MNSWLTSLIGMSLAAWTLLGRQVPFRNGVNTNESVVVNSGGICYTEACYQVADAFINSMTQSIDPCVNFYEYACGNWLSSNPVPTDTPKLSWNAVARFTNLAQHRLRGLLEAEPSAKDILPIKQMKKMYKSCINASEGIESIMRVFREANGWPMIMNNGTWKRDGLRWREIDQYYEDLLGYSNFWKLKIRRSSRGRGDLVIQPPSFALDELTPEGMHRYRSVMKTLTKFFIKENNANVADEQLENDIDDVLTFEKTLAQVKKNEAVPYRNASFSVKDMYGKAPSTAQRQKIWRKFFGRFLDIANLSKTSEAAMHMENLFYFSKLKTLLKSTDERTIVNFMHWRFLLCISPYSSMEIMKIWLPLSSIIKNSQLQKPRWRRCILQEDPATIRLFGEELNGNTTKLMIETMITNIRKKFELQTAKSNWLSVETKEAIKKKLNSMKYQIGYPEWYDNDTTLIEYYVGLTIGDSYLENVFSWKKTYWTNQIRSWGKAMKDEVWPRWLLLGNTAYSLNQNTLTVPVIDFQPPLFHGVLPKYVEYGTIGWIIGHEIGHIVDERESELGLKPDKTLFTDNMTVIFPERVRCFVNMFDKYFNGIGFRTLRENIADWYGIQAAFEAYEEVRDEKYPDGELKLPKFYAFTDERMFFISAAQALCTASTKWMKGDSHSPKNLRVINTLSNTLAFAETFDCPINTPMNPKEKCDMWMKPN